MGYGRISQVGDGPRAVPNDRQQQATTGSRPYDLFVYLRGFHLLPLTIPPSKPKVRPKKIIGHIGRTRLWPIGIAIRVNANKISADGCARYGAIAEVLSL